MPALTMNSVAERIGEELGVSQWTALDQPRIQAFADCTGDQQWIHVDPERAARETPFGGTIAHGMFTLSLVAKWVQELSATPRDASAVLNYGFDKVRFLTPVKSGRKVRGRLKLASVTPKEQGRLLIGLGCTVEIEGESKPALMADFLVMALPA